MTTLILVRGLPGSGKSTFASMLSSSVLAADDYFVRDGIYQFDPTKLPEAHAACLARCKALIMTGTPIVAVANTFSQTWEMASYMDVADEHDLRLFVVDLFDNGLTDKELHSRNIHGVPLEGIKNMRDRWEHDWKVGDPRPPWLRGGNS